MIKLFAFSFIALLSVSTSFAQNGDLVLPGEKWIAKFKDFVCVASGPSVSTPSAFSQMDVKFEKITTDSTLDNGLIKGTFKNGEVTCRYNALVLADNDLKTIKLVSSKAYTTTENGSCAEGKAILDALFLDNQYPYYGHPHNLAIMAPVAGADSVCQGATQVGINFVVTGRVANQL